MPPKKDKNQQNFDFHFHLGDLGSSSLMGGSQEELSDFDRNLRLSIRDLLDCISKREKDPMDRYEVAANMSRILGRDISKTHLDQWTAMSTVQRRIHVDSLKALCEVAQDFSPLHYFVESCGFKALSKDEAACAEYGAKMALKRAIDSDLKDLQSNLDSPTLIAHLVNRTMGKDKE